MPRPRKRATAAGEEPDPLSATSVAEIWRKVAPRAPTLTEAQAEGLATVLTALRRHRAWEHDIGPHRTHQRAAEAIRRLLVGQSAGPRRAADLRLLWRACHALLLPIEAGFHAPKAPWAGVVELNALHRLRAALGAEPSAEPADKAGADAFAVVRAQRPATEPPPDLREALAAALPVFAPHVPARAPAWDIAARAAWLAVGAVLAEQGRPVGATRNAVAVRLAVAYARRLGFPGVATGALAQRL